MKSFAQLVTSTNYEKLGSMHSKIQYLPDFVLKLGASYLPPVKLPHLAGACFFPQDKKEGCAKCAVQGQVLCCPVTVETLLRLPLKHTLQIIANCLKHAEKNGAKIVGLSPWLSFISSEGSLLADKITVPITSGQRFRIFTALEGLKFAAKSLNIDWNSANIVIWGIDNYIGQISARLLARQGKFLTLINTQEENYEELVAKIIYETGVAVKITKDCRKGLQFADVVLITTPMRRDFDIQLLKKGVIVYDMNPQELSDVRKIRRDIVYIKGGIFNVPGVPYLKWADGISKGYALDYMVELMLLSLENQKELDVSSEINIQQVEKIGKKSEEYGFYLSGLYRYNSTGEIAEIRN